MGGAHDSLQLILTCGTDGECGSSTPHHITEMCSGIRVARCGALSVRPPNSTWRRKINKNAAKDVIKSYYGGVGKEGGKWEEGGWNVDDALTSSAGGKKLACRSNRMEEERREKCEFCSWTLFILPPRRRELQSCNNATDRQPALSSCNFLVKEELTWMATLNIVRATGGDDSKRIWKRYPF